MDDYDSVLSLWDKAKLSYRPEGRDSRARVEKELKLERSIFLVAESRGKVVGTVLGTHDGRKGWINRLAVAKDYRHQDIARRLVAEVEKQLEGLGFEVIAALIEGDNKTSMQVFERLGYQKSAVAYYSKRKSARA